MSEQYEVIGQCKVAGVAPGGTVSREELEKAGANIDVLIGPHLKPVDSAPTAKTAEPKKTATK